MVTPLVCPAQSLTRSQRSPQVRGTQPGPNTHPSLSTLQRIPEALQPPVLELAPFNPLNPDPDATSGALGSPVRALAAGRPDPVRRAMNFTPDVLTGTASFCYTCIIHYDCLFRESLSIRLLMLLNDVSNIVSYLVNIIFYFLNALT